MLKFSYLDKVMIGLCKITYYFCQLKAECPIVHYSVQWGLNKLIDKDVFIMVKPLNFAC